MGQTNLRAKKLKLKNQKNCGKLKFNAFNKYKNIKIALKFNIPM
jgi:hypothetical protein